MYELKNYQSILKEKAEKANVFFDKYPEIAKEDVRRFIDINETKIKNGKPEIMVYGIYNAGKSSILNELIGQDLAKVQDKPETDKVTYYEWQGYKLADTPGVSAPIEHEDVTQEHLKKADIVLFVMSTTGSTELQDNYNRMKKIADSGKKIIIVLNDKNGDMGRNDESIRIIKQKVDMNMRQTGINNVENKYCIVTVNAERAYQGRKKGKEALIEKSGMNELKDVVLAELLKTSSIEVLRQSIAELEKILTNFITELQDEENSAVLKKMNQVLDTFDREKISMFRQVNLFIDMQSDSLAATLPQKIWDAGDNASAAEALLKDEVEKIVKKVEEEIRHQLEDTLAVLTLELKSFVELKTPENNEDAQSLKNVLEALSSSMSEFNSNGEFDGKEGDNSTLDFVAVNAAANLIANGGQEIMSTLAKTAIGKTLAKTAVGKFVGNIAGGLVPVVGPVITVISAISTLAGLLGNNKKYEEIQRQLEQRNLVERQRIEAAMQARQELNQKCIYIANNIARSLKENAIEAMKETLEKCEKPFREELENRKNKGAALMDDVERVRALKGEYSSVRIELGGY